MSLLSPITALIAAGILIPSLLLLYFLKLRRRRIAVSTTLLWQKAIQDLQVNSPFQKIRRNLLLLLQLIILLALLIALARPALHADAEVGKRVVILIDHSASMNATDITPTRLAEAKQAAYQLIDSLDLQESQDDQSGAMVVSFAGSAKVRTRFTSDRAKLKQAVDQIQSTDQPSRLAEALAIIEPDATQADGSGKQMQVYVISDGRVQMSSNQSVALRGAKLRYIKVGSKIDDSTAPNHPDNIAIVRLAARRDLQRPHILQLFATLANYSNKGITTNLKLFVDDKIVQVKKIKFKAMQQETPDEQIFTFDLIQPDSAAVRLNVDYEDALVADNTASMMIAPSKQLRVLLVTGGQNASVNRSYWERAVRSMGVQDLVYMTPKRYEDQDHAALRRAGWDAGVTGITTMQGFDLIIFDDYAPTTPPNVNSLYFGSPPSIQGIDIKTSLNTERLAYNIISWEQTHSLLRHLTLSDVMLINPGRLVLTDDASVLANARSGPVMAHLIRDGTQYVFTAFSLSDTRWPLHYSFPMFVQNALQTMGLGSQLDTAGLHYLTGQYIKIPVEQSATSVTYTGPTTVSQLQIRDQLAVLGPMARAGEYHTDQTDIQPPYDRLFVNLLDPIESDLRPVDQLVVGSVSTQGQSRRAAITREIWHYFAWIALAFLLIEWFLYTRRMHI
ncbi:vWA domain-containing protein [Poriferisphaera sp. WC338]|uniref:vWA domain-containing protein n=1 Tax=Poriferisphaera sp. WC338 TaxID=3425129 RepID=UPI003D81B72F